MWKSFKDKARAKLIVAEAAVVLHGVAHLSSVGQAVEAIIWE